MEEKRGGEGEEKEKERRGEEGEGRRRGGVLSDEGGLILIIKVEK